MPELPEVETMRRGIGDVVGSTIEQVEFARCRCKPIELLPSRATLRRRLIGQTIQGIGRIGKRVVVEFPEDRLVIEPRMTGLILLADPPDEEHLRVGWQLRSGQRGGAIRWLWYWDRRGLGRVIYHNPRSWSAWLADSGLGPDALTISLGELRDRLVASRREIKVALLDQRSLAGVGNLYASEILFVARIHPQTPCNLLTNPQWERLHQSLVEVLREAVHYEGSTLADGTYRNALNHQGRYQNHHRVYARIGQVCPGCGETFVQRIVQAQRSTFFCPTCQPLAPCPS